jgi:hypothetical protein
VSAQLTSSQEGLSSMKSVCINKASVIYSQKESPCLQLSMARPGYMITLGFSHIGSEYYNNRVAKLHIEGFRFWKSTQFCFIHLHFYVIPFNMSTLKDCVKF